MSGIEIQNGQGKMSYSEHKGMNLKVNGIYLSVIIVGKHLLVVMVYAQLVAVVIRNKAGGEMKHIPISCCGECPYVTIIVDRAGRPTKTGWCINGKIYIDNFDEKIISKFCKLEDCEEQEEK